MNVNAKNNLSKKIIKNTKTLGNSRNAMIWCAPKEWPDSIKQFKGVPDFPSFESYRDELSFSEA